MSPTTASLTYAWRLRLLGGFELDDGRQVLRRLRSRAAMALLARLALWPDRDHSREELAALLWPDGAPEAVRGRLRQTLSLLRDVLEPPGSAVAVLADRHAIRLAPRVMWCDAEAFARAAAAGQTELARQLYRGEFLPGLYDEWIDEHRRHLESVHERLAEAPPLRARPLPAGASAVWQPAPLPVSDQANPPPVATAPPALPAARLPHYLTSLIGAEPAVLELCDRVRQHRWVSLVGPGGVGKTRLAIEAAHRLVAPAGGQVNPEGRPGRTADGPVSPAGQSNGAAAAFERALFVSLVDVADRAALLDALLLALHLESSTDPIARIADAVAGQRLLLVLDNGELLDDSAVDALAALAERTPEAHWLLTSRRVAGLDGEAVVPLGTLPLPEPHSGADAEPPALDALAANPAVALYLDRARAHRSDFQLRPGNAEALVALVRRLEGLPLAIELAAARTRTLAPADWLQLLEGLGGLGLLARRSRRAGDSREASMLAVVERSWALLPPAARQMLQALCVLPAGATAEAAHHLAGETSAAQTQTLLDLLVEHSVLRVLAGRDGQARYQPYQPVRDYALAQLDEPAQRALRRRALAWLTEWAAALPATPPLASVRDELPAVMQALARAPADGDADAALRLAVMLQTAWGEIALPAGALQSLDALLQAPDLDDSHAAAGHALAATAYQVIGDADAVRRHGERALARPCPDVALRANVLSRVARMRWRVDKDAAGARAMIEQALPLAREAGKPNTEGALLSLAAHLASVVDRDHERAKMLAAQSLALWARSGNRHLVNAGRYNAAVQTMEAGRPAEVLAEFEALEREGRALQDWDLAAGALEARGTALLRLRRWAESAASLRESLAVAWAGMETMAAAYALWNLPPALVRLRRADLAAFAMGAAEAVWRQRFGRFDDRDRRDLKRVRRGCRLLLGPAAAAAEWQRGAAAPMGAAVREVLAAFDPPA